ncbi:anti sigma factor C-terminal domain-containing protein [Halalkalibacter urbisdiaboli]|uniref:anti sigma factor C-terminal domain-containing protein n=1 Tax=Halalkalibacter urbisdiaboli TaxID=1960589 RepID=UPI000B436F06|nr:anti sigma factor C-terminal domain-containing protein [Halalkalibacter urbisdiaboli]
MTYKKEDHFDTQALYKRAKAKMLIRNILTAFIVTLLTLVALFYLQQFLVQRSITYYSTADSALSYIKGANVEVHGTSVEYNFLQTATTKTSNIKWMRDIPYLWSESERNIALFGVSSKKRPPVYIPTEDATYYDSKRVMKFVHPAEEKVINDFPHLQEIDDTYYVELGLSFDQAYSIEEIRAELGPTLVQWYWVETAEQGGYADDVYGFSGFSEKGADTFLYVLNEQLVKDNPYENMIRRVTLQLTNWEKRPVTKEDLSIIGAVVVGTPQELEAITDHPMIKSASLGLTLAKY